MGLQSDLKKMDFLKIYSKIPLDNLPALAYKPNQVQHHPECCPEGVTTGFGGNFIILVEFNIFPGSGVQTPNNCLISCQSSATTKF